MKDRWRDYLARFIVFAAIAAFLCGILYAILNFLPDIIGLTLAVVLILPMWTFLGWVLTKVSKLRV